jgi:hypothetical protein
MNQVGRHLADRDEALNTIRLHCYCWGYLVNFPSAAFHYPIVFVIGRVSRTAGCCKKIKGQQLILKQTMIGHSNFDSKVGYFQ